VNLFGKPEEKKAIATGLPAALTAEADAIDQAVSRPFGVGLAESGAPAPGAAPRTAAVIAADPTDYTAEAADVIEFAYDNFIELYPSLGRVYTPEVRKKLAAKGGAVLKKRGWTMDRLFDRWGAELALVMAVQPLVMPTYRLIQADRAADAARQAQEEATGTPASRPPAQGAPGATAGAPAAPGAPVGDGLPPAPLIPMPT